MLKRWDKELHDDLIWDNRRLIVKYTAFLSYDKEKCKNETTPTSEGDILMDIEVQLPVPVRSNRSNELIRERDFYRAKGQANDRN